MYDYLIILLIITGGLALLLGLKIAQLPRTPATRALILLVAATALWSIGYAFELDSPSLEASLFWAKIEYFGIVTIPVGWLLFAVSYANPAKRFSFLRGKYILLWIIPILTMIMVMTNSAHNLVWSNISLEQGESFSSLSLTYGTWFWINLFYSYILLLTGSILLVGILIYSIHILRWQTALVLVAILIPWIANILYIYNPGWLPELDFTPFAFFLSCLLLFINLYEFNLASSQPIPRMLMIESLPDGLLVLDRRGRILDLNLSARRIIGRKGDKFIGQDFLKLLPNAHAQISLTQFNESKSTQVIGEGTDRQDYQMVISPLANQEGNLQSNLVVLHKIEPRGQLVTTNEADDRIQDIINLEPDAILLVNLERDIRLVNSQAEELFDYTREEMCQVNLDTLIPERFRYQHQANVSRFFANPSNRQMGTQMDLYALKKDGTEFPVDISLSPLNTGEELLVACAVRDISAQKKIEQTLKEREETYHALFEHANDAIFLLSLTGIHLQVNQKAADLLGYSKEELIGMGVSDIVVPEEYPIAQDRLVDIMGGITPPLYELTFRTKDGGTIPVEINNALVFDTDGKPIFIQSIVRNITGRKRIEQEQLNLLKDVKQSREALRALEAHIMQVSEEERRALATELHDRVGQNLTGLNLNLNIISNQLRIGDQIAVQSRLEDSIELVEETSRLVRNVLADLRPPMLDDYGLFSALRWYCEKYSQRTNIKITLKGEECEPRLPAQVELILFRIVQEALNNITKHAQADQVVIDLTSNTESVYLCIQDDGIGFDQAILTTSSREPHLGLLNMQERAHSIGGSLTVTTTPGQGTQILVELQREVRDD